MGYVPAQIKYQIIVSNDTQYPQNSAKKYIQNNIIRSSRLNYILAQSSLRRVPPFFKDISFTKSSKKIRFIPSNNTIILLNSVKFSQDHQGPVFIAMVTHRPSYLESQLQSNESITVNTHRTRPSTSYSLLQTCQSDAVAAQIFLNPVNSNHWIQADSPYLLLH